jgi:hypothetical protein
MIHPGFHYRLGVGGKRANGNADEGAWQRPGPVLAPSVCPVALLPAAYRRFGGDGGPKSLPKRGLGRYRPGNGEAAPSGEGFDGSVLRLDKQLGFCLLSPACGVMACPLKMIAGPADRYFWVSTQAAVVRICAERSECLSLPASARNCPTSSLRRACFVAAGAEEASILLNAVAS